MTYYDHIAAQWHAATGYKGGPFKERILNQKLLSLLDGIDGRALLELGAGNGYFMPMLLRRFSGQTPTRIVITDQSRALLQIAERTFRLDGGEYLPLDVSKAFPFGNGTLDVIVATMVFQELPAAALQRAAAECYRTLAPGGQLLATVVHPRFVDDLARRGLLRRYARGIYTMPGTGSLRLPVMRHSMNLYTSGFRRMGFHCTTEEIRATSALLHAKPGLRHAGMVPIALVLNCAKPTDDRAAGARR